MKIGDLARQSGCPAATIRYYERERLLPAPARSAGDYRLYGAEHIERLSFIRHCRSLDMSLDEIRALLKFRDAPDRDCGEVNALLDEHIGHVAARIAELRRLERQLRALRLQCGRPRTAKECGILGELAHGANERADGKPAAGHVRSTHGRTRSGGRGPARMRGAG